jgi:hypothetical protein
MAADFSSAFSSRASDMPNTFGTVAAGVAGSGMATPATDEPTGTFTDPTPKPSPPPMDPPPRSRLRPHRGGMRRLLNSLLRILDLQYRIWLTQAKLTIQKMMLYAILFVGAAILGLLAIIFLYIGLFRVLTDVAGIAPVWAYLIFGGLHLVIAVALIMVGTSILGKKDEDDDDKKKDKDPQAPASHT